MTGEYRHTQPGHVMRAALGGGVILPIAVTVAFGFHWVSAAVTVVLILSLLLFHQLTVEVGCGAVALSFGIGLIRKTFLLSEIESCRPVRNHWYYGWGIKWMPHGWLFNVSGLSAVELQMKSGRKHRIGTDEPDALADEIRRVARMEERTGDEEAR